MIMNSRRAARAAQVRVARVRGRVASTAVAAGATLSMAVTGLVGLAPATPASASSSATVTSVTMSRSSVAVDGLNLVPVTFTVHINDPGGMTKTAIKGVTWWYPRLVLQKVSGNGWVPWLAVSLEKSSGTATDGDWTGKINIPSTANGVWEAAGIWVSGPPTSPTLVPARRPGPPSR